MLIKFRYFKIRSKQRVSENKKTLKIKNTIPSHENILFIEKLKLGFYFQQAYIQNPVRGYPENSKVVGHP